MRVAAIAARAVVSVAAVATRTMVREAITVTNISTMMRVSNHSVKHSAAQQSQREHAKQIGKKFAQSLGLYYFFSSVKWSLNSGVFHAIGGLFCFICTLYYRRLLLHPLT